MTTPDDPTFVTTQWLDESVTKLVLEKTGTAPEVACKVAASVIELLVGSDKKRIEQYYPGLAEKVRRLYRLTIDAMRAAADSKGYALAVHGSLSRDIDLIACPWREDAASAEEVAEAIRAAAEKANPDGVCFPSPPLPRAKPHGRLCWSLHLGGGPYIDLSVMPRLPAPTADS